MNYLALHLDLESLYRQDSLIYLKSQEALEILPAQECQRVLGLLKGREEIISTARKSTIVIIRTHLSLSIKNGIFKMQNTCSSH